MIRRVPKTAAGFALLEVLIAALVLSLGVLTIIALQARTVNEYRDSKMRQYATVLAGDLADRIRANRVAAAAYADSNFAAAADKACAASAATPCTAAELAADDLYHWQTYLNMLGFNVGTGNASEDTTVAIDTASTPARVVINMRWSSRGSVQSVTVNTEVL